MARPGTIVVGERTYYAPVAHEFAATALEQIALRGKDDLIGPYEIVLPEPSV